MVVFGLEMWALRCVSLGPLGVCAPVFWGLGVEVQGLTLFMSLVGAAGGLKPALEGLGLHCIPGRCPRPAMWGGS